MGKGGIFDLIKGRIKKNFLDASGYSQFKRESEDITRSLGLIYREQSPLPLPRGKKYGDLLPASNNAITHAYVSAKMAQRYGTLAARAFGDGREYLEPPKDLVEESWDTFKDQWNNEVGRRAGASAVGMSNEELIEIIKDAWRNGDLITVSTDGRIPKDYRYSYGSVYNFDPGSVRMRAKLPELRSRVPSLMGYFPR